MADGKASPGQVFVPPPAEVWNNMIDAGRAFADSRLDGDRNVPTMQRETNLLRLENNSGAERAKGQILKILGKAITDLSEEHTWLGGTTPTDHCFFGILKEPIAAGDPGIVQVGGRCLAFVNLTDADHTKADAVDGSYILESGTSGPIDILYTPGLGVNLCAVKFGCCGSEPNCQPFIGTASADIPVGESGSVERDTCPRKDSEGNDIPEDVTNGGSETIGSGCKVLAIPSNCPGEECTYTGVPLGCPDDCEGFSGARYPIVGYWTTYTENGVELHWQDEVWNYEKGRLCTVENGTVGSSTVTTWYCCYPPVCEDVYFKEVDCDDVYVGFYDQEDLEDDPAGGTFVGTCTITIDDVDYIADMYAFCTSPSGDPLHIESGVTVACVVFKIGQLGNVISLREISYDVDHNWENFGCCPDLGAGEFAVGYVPGYCETVSTDPRKNVVAKCFADDPGVPWVPNFPARARRTAAKDPNCCEDVDDPDPCCCPEYEDIGTHFEASSNHLNDDESETLAKSFRIKSMQDPGTETISFIGGIIPLLDGQITMDPEDWDAINIEPESFVTIPVWVVDESDNLIRVHLMIQINVSCGENGWTATIRIPAIGSEPEYKEFTGGSTNCCIGTIEIPPEDVVAGLVGYAGRSFTPPANPVEITVGCPIDGFECEYEDPCEYVYTAAIRVLESDITNGCCCPECTDDGEGGGESGDTASALGVTADFVCDPEDDSLPFVATLVVDVPYSDASTVEHTFVISMRCTNGRLRGTITTNTEPTPVTFDFACDIDTEETKNGSALVEVPASHLLQVVGKTVDPVDITFDFSLPADCGGCTQWSYCEYFGVGGPGTAKAPSSKWKYVGYSPVKQACVYAACATFDLYDEECTDRVPPTWLTPGTHIPSNLDLGMHRKPISYWQLDPVDAENASLEDTCCDCAPWSESYSIADAGGEESCCPEVGDNYKIKCMVTGGMHEITPWLTGENSYSVSFRYPIGLTSTSLTTKENKTTAAEDEGDGLTSDVTILIEMTAYCTDGEWSVEVYLSKTEGQCENCIDSIELIATLGFYGGCFPTLTIPAARVREAVECIWSNDMFPCCDPADWILPQVQISFTCVDDEPICERPDCQKIVTVGLVHTTKSMPDAASDPCCGCNSEDETANVFGVLEAIFHQPTGNTYTVGVSTGWIVDPDPTIDPLELIIPIWHLPTKLASVSKISFPPHFNYQYMTLDLPCEDSMFTAGSLAFDLGNIVGCHAPESDLWVAITPDPTNRCQPAEVFIYKNMLWHIVNDPELLLQDIPPTGSIDPPEDCVIGSQFYSLSMQQSQRECADCADIAEFDFEEWTYAGFSSLKKRCVLVACCIPSYNEETEECECNAPELPDPPAGWEYEEISEEPLEWWGIGPDANPECCPAGCCLGPESSLYVTLFTDTVVNPADDDLEIDTILDLCDTLKGSGSDSAVLEVVSPTDELSTRTVTFSFTAECIDGEVQVTIEVSSDGLGTATLGPFAEADFPVSGDLNTMLGLIPTDPDAIKFPAVEFDFFCED